MLKSAAVEHFGSQKAIAAVLSISESAVSQWEELVPPLSAAKLAKASDGVLVFDPDLYESWNGRKAS